MATAAVRWSFPPAWGDSLRTLTDIQRETVFVSVEKVTRMRGSRGGPLPEVGPHGVGVGDAKGRAKGKQDVGDPERDAGVPATPTPVGAASLHGQQPQPVAAPAGHLDAVTTR